jgi:hypothetical protein
MFPHVSHTILPVAAALALLAAACSSSAASPDNGEHWHASYAVWVCDQQVTDLPASDYTFGDGAIHLSAGGRLTLPQLFESLGGELTADSLRLPDEDRPWRNHNICNGGRPGRVAVVVNDAALWEDELNSYTLKDGDRVMVAFAPSGSVAPSVPPPPEPLPH